ATRRIRSLGGAGGASCIGAGGAAVETTILATPAQGRSVGMLQSNTIRQCPKSFSLRLGGCQKGSSHKSLGRNRNEPAGGSERTGRGRTPSKIPPQRHAF